MSCEEKRDEQFGEIEEFGESSGSSNGHLNELAYKLDWAIRDEIILNLNGYTQQLCGKASGSAANEKLMQANAALYQRLINLSATSDEERPDKEPRPSEVALELAFSAKCQIISALMANQSLTGVTASEETRLQMIKQNNRLVSRLMDLPVSVSQGTAEEANGQLSSDAPNRLTGHSEMADQIASLNKANEGQQLKIGEQEKKISALNLELKLLSIDKPRTASDKLRALVRLADGKVDIGLKRQKVEVDFSIGGMAAFLESAEKIYRKSEFFFCNHLAWSVEVSKQELEGQTYLSVYLRATNYANDSSNWSTRAVAKVTLLNSNTWFNESYGNKLISNLEFSKHSPSWGWHRFITIDELANCSFMRSSFIKNDEIKFRVYLLTKKTAEPASASSCSKFIYLSLAPVPVLLLLILVKLW